MSKSKLRSGGNACKFTCFSLHCFFAVQLFNRQRNSPATPIGATTATRPCGANHILTSAEKKKESHKPKHPLPPEPAPVCVEVKGEGIEIQEFLQKTAREQAWRIGENRLSENTRSYVRYLDPGELEKYADTKVLIEPSSLLAERLR